MEQRRACVALPTLPTHPRKREWVRTFWSHSMESRAGILRAHLVHPELTDKNPGCFVRAIYNSIEPSDVEKVLPLEWINHYRLFQYEGILATHAAKKRRAGCDCFP